CPANAPAIVARSAGISARITSIDSCRSTKSGTTWTSGALCQRLSMGGPDRGRSSSSECSRMEGTRSRLRYSQVRYRIVMLLVPPPCWMPAVMRAIGPAGAASGDGLRLAQLDDVEQVDDRFDSPDALGNLDQLPALGVALDDAF